MRIKIVDVGEHDFYAPVKEQFVGKTGEFEETIETKKGHIAGHFIPDEPIVLSEGIQPEFMRTVPFTFALLVATELEKCPECKGSCCTQIMYDGGMQDQPCPFCDGSGEVEK